MRTEIVNGLRVFYCNPEGPLLGSYRDALDLIGETYGQEIDVVAIPVVRLLPDFLQLRSGLAGEFIQKFQNYSLRLAIVGDISAAVGASKALHDFVYESNTIGRHLFVADEAELAARLQPL